MLEVGSLERNVGHKDHNGKDIYINHLEKNVHVYVSDHSLVIN